MKDFAIFLAIATLSGLGVGSGGLLVIYLTLVEKLPQLASQGTNLIFFILASLSSLVFNLPKRHIPLGAVALMSLFGICGSLMGSSLAPLMPALLLRKIFGVMLVGSGIIALKRK